MYYHSVTLDKDKCMGCTNCIKRCPTEAIRVRDGRARIIAERCIDCGECIRVCPYHAKIAVTDPLEIINDYKYKIALPAPTLYAQFNRLRSIDCVLYGLKAIGFDDVYEVARGADFISEFTKHELLNSEYKKPMISTACPAIARLVMVRFPELIEHLAKIESPMEISAQMAKEEYSKKHGVPIEDIGAFFITPCAAKMTSIKSPIGRDKSAVDGTISILDIYGPLSTLIDDQDIVFTEGSLQRSTYKGVGWANSGGEGSSIGNINFLAVDGIHNVMKVLEEIENGHLNDLDFFEGLACVGGCVGGPLTFENNFVAQNRLRQIISKMEPGEDLSQEEIMEAMEKYDWQLDQEIEAKPIMILDEDISKAIKMMAEIERINKELPGLDCGSCGSPSCRTLAEDIVLGYANEYECVFVFKDKMKELAGEMLELSENGPVGKKKEKEDED